MKVTILLFSFSSLKQLSWHLQLQLFVLPHTPFSCPAIQTTSAQPCCTEPWQPTLCWPPELQDLCFHIFCVRVIQHILFIFSCLSRASSVHKCPATKARLWWTDFVTMNLLNLSKRLFWSFLPQHCFCIFLSWAFLLFLLHPCQFSQPLVFNQLHHANANGHSCNHPFTATGSLYSSFHSSSDFVFLHTCNISCLFHLCICVTPNQQVSIP